MKVITGSIALATLVLSASVTADPIYRISYKGFDVWFNCETRMAEKWHYKSQKNTGNYPRHDRFYADPSLPKHCQQKSLNTYKTPKGATKFHRGHLVPANAMDSDALSIKHTNIMVNILPQVAQMNTGAWKQTEEFEQCRKDQYDLNVKGGVYVGKAPKFGDFRISHGIQAPEAFWKIVYTNENAIAWWVPNSPLATASKVDDYIVTVEYIEKMIGESIDIPIELKKQKPTSTNARLSGCDLS